MKHPKFCIALFMLSVSIFSYGQSDFRPGYIITHEFDTIYGQIDYRGDLRLSKFCVFKDNPKSDPVEYKPGEIFAYRFEQGKFFVSKTVTIEKKEKVFFLEFLVNGQANLYYFRDEAGDHYLIENEDGNLLELTNDVNEVFIDGTRYQKESHKYIGQLKASFSDCAEIQSDIEKTSFSQNSLIKITSSYHDYVCDGEKCIIYRKETPAFRVIVAPVAGIGISFIGFELNSLLENMSFESSWSPEMGVQFNFLAPRINEKISVLVELLVSKNYHYGYYEEELGSQTYYYDAHLNTAFLNTVLGFKYTYPKGLVRPTIALGGQNHLLVWSNTSYLEEIVYDQTVTTNSYPEIPENRLLWGGIAELGVDLHMGQKFTMFCNLRAQSSWGIGNEVSTSLQSVSAVVGIYF